MHTETIRIDRMGAGPEAVGRTSAGKAVFVEGAAPGDVVEVEITEDKGSFAYARLVRVAEPSPLRVDAACPAASAGTCGGCPWAHLSYQAQLDAKRANIESVLVRTAKLPAERVASLMRDVLPSKRQWGYRNKLEMGATCENGRFTLGFFREGTHEISSPERCPLAHKAAERAPKALRGALRFAQGADDWGIFRVGVRTSMRTHETEIALWTPPGAFPRAHAAKTLASSLKATSIVRVIADPGAARIVKRVEVLEGKGCWSEEVAGAKFLASAPSFFQVNTAQAEKLVACAMEGLGIEPGMLVADLYSGVGTFAVPFALAGADVIAVESAGSSVRDLRRNADLNRVDIEVIGGDTARELPELGELDALVVDPPRAGLAKGVPESIAAARPERVAYVSCNPATLARDIARLETCGYKLTSVQPVDLFPQTPHVETVCIFTRG